MSDNVLALIAIFAVPASFAFSALIIIRAFRQGIKDGVDKSVARLIKELRGDGEN